MSTLDIHPLPYQADNTALFSRLLALPHPALLDSGRPGSGRGRYDIFSADPISVIQRDVASVDADGLGAVLDGLERELERQIPPPEDDHGLPFPGGVIGWLSYEAGMAWQHVQAADKPGYSPAALCAGFYPWAVIADHEQQTSALVVHPTAEHGTARNILDLLNSEAPAHTELLVEGLEGDTEFDAYSGRFDRIQEYIRAGDCYQINLARCLHGKFSGDPWQRYAALRNATAAPFSAYLKWPGAEIISLSPERFIGVEGRRIVTEPIKGTAARDGDPQVDRDLASKLSHSPKDHAENLMIVDLLRNDLGRVCKSGSVSVDAMFELQTFNTVHHLVSTISGELADAESPLTALAACFPGGSVTGAPKRRAMQIIDELEPLRRGLYCGSVFYLGSNRRLESNIAIRTLQFIGDRVSCFGGGGIVSDSVGAAEFKESSDKIDIIIKYLLNSS